MQVLMNDVYCYYYLFIVECSGILEITFNIVQINRLYNVVKLQN